MQRDTSPNDSSALQKGELDFFRTLLDSAASRDSTAEVKRCSSPWYFVHHFTKITPAAGAATVREHNRRPD
jgi:hypothetical protein